MKSEGIRKYILQHLGVLLRRKLKTVVSENVNSVLKHKLDPEHNLFCWDACTSLRAFHHALLLLRVFTECNQTCHK